MRNGAKYYKCRRHYLVLSVNVIKTIKMMLSRLMYLDDLLNIENLYPPEQQLNNANTIDTGAPFLD